ncbi:MAG: c-type cytochrome biogenesis protein CcmI [Rubrivivax sp. SCN 71-131]|jgi:cytochrome c-type biogenesis protein CcmH|nr:MAG: c-type cytochrome biogenesis protein CcmI [Rubrivivax sp. SCN 71-131]
MSTFVLAAAGLTLVVLAALWLALRRADVAPDVDEAASNVRILRVQLAELRAERDAGTIDAAAFEASHAELQRRVLAEAAPAASASGGRSLRGAMLLLLLAVPAIAAALYALLGNRQALDPMLAQPPSQFSPQDVDAMVERLAERMKADPSDADGWQLLGRSYMAMQRFDAARDALAQALQRQPGDAQLLADLADATAMAQGQDLLGEPEKLIAQALHADPDNLKALALAGTAAMLRREPKAAADYFERALRVAPPDSPYVSGLQDGLQQARAAAGLPPAPAATTAPRPVNAQVPAAAAAPGPASAAQSAAAPLAVQVTLAPTLAGKVREGDTLFVFARAAEGPRMPLAIARQAVGPGTRWPVAVTLDDTTAMAPQFRLSGVARVVVGARISRSGRADPEPGDLEGQGAPMAPAGSAALTIDRVR